MAFALFVSLTMTGQTWNALVNGSVFELNIIFSPAVMKGEVCCKVAPTCLTNAFR